MHGRDGQNAKHKLLRRGLIVFAWLLLWQLVSAVVHNPFYFAGPAESAAELLHRLPQQAFREAVGASCIRIWTGFALAAVSAYGMAFLAMRFPLLEEVLAPFVSFIRAVPVAALVVVFLIWSGASRLVLYISFMVVFPNVYENMLTGLKKTDEKMLEMARVFRIPFVKRLRCIYRPAYLPYCRAAVSHSAGMCFKAGVAAELIGLPDHSMGTALYMDKISLNTAGVFAWMAVVAAVSFVTEKLLLRITGAALIPRVKETDRQLTEAGGAQIRLQGVEKSLGGKKILDGVELQVPSGGRLCLYGDSGMGKSTLLHLLAGLLDTDDGRHIQSRAGVCFQENRLWEDAGAAVNLWMAGCAGNCREELLQLLPAALLDKPVKEMSGGEKRRVALARAVLFPSEWLLLDEPFAGLDDANRKKAAAWILKRQQGRPMIVATHDEADFALLKAEKVTLDHSGLHKI